MTWWRPSFEWPCVELADRGARSQAHFKRVVVVQTTSERHLHRRRLAPRTSPLVHNGYRGEYRVPMLAALLDPPAWSYPANGLGFLSLSV